MAKPNYAFQKRQRELAKKQKKEAKKQQKMAENAPADEAGVTAGPDMDSAPAPDDPASPQPDKAA